MGIRFAQSQAERLVERLGIEAAAVDVREVAATLGLSVMETDLGEGMSGLLVTGGGKKLICVQKGDHKHRQRFTIAHEIGHFHLRHQFEPGEHVHVDKGLFVSQRGPRASEGIDSKEIEANQFAASLLMPSRLVLREAQAIGEPLSEEAIRQLARTFQVSEQAMTIRLTTLGLL